MPNLIERVKLAGAVLTGASFKPMLAETVGFGRASLWVDHRRPQNFLKLAPHDTDEAYANKLKLETLIARGARVESDGSLWLPDVRSYLTVDAPETVLNQITNAGRDFLHQQGYQTSGLGVNGLNFIALTNTAVTPAAGDTTLTGEIAVNGLSRAQGTVGHTTGTNTTTVDHTFTCATAPQAAQAAALFTASSVGTMNHELTFAQRSLQIGDTLQTTYTITLG